MLALYEHHLLKYKFSNGSVMVYFVCVNSALLYFFFFNSVMNEVSYTKSIKLFSTQRELKGLEARH
ncbi:hypothetical protein CXF79_10020 [Colwellia sp. Bg11-28]|uniref:Uncharacterized protein n=1 Tax=Colwellia psychrerythraea (strain 34H / ATCC BAA-681) TaxID=167879 RepID=Q47Z02_COLP3|nr:hypothetical protein CPS_3292 [Colwellia psychrerythraea 34H]PKH87050.1 hypothetical protein CXF79_10020 [Colwellia sp. Bg11-28]